MIPIGLDIGYYATKVSANGLTKVFPSVLTEGMDEELLSLSARNTSIFLVEVGGKKYFVGESSLNLSKRGKRRETANYHLSDEWYTLFLAALTEIGIPSGETLVVGTGLPASFYSKEAAKALREVLSGHHEITRGGQTHVYHVGMSVVSSQFFGAATGALAQNHPVAPYLSEARRVAVADGGGRTWNFGVLSEMRIVTDSTFTRDLGSWNAAGEMEKVLRAKFNYQFTPHEAMQALETGKIFFDGEDQEVREEANKVLDNLAAPIYEVFEDEWGNVIGTTACLYLTGGTPLLLGKRLQKLHRNTFFGGQFDNALGYEWLVREKARAQGLL